MALIATRARARKSNPLPLFEWADQQGTPVFSPLRITKKLEQRYKLPPSTLNAWATANGFTQGDEHHGQ